MLAIVVVAFAVVVPASAAVGAARELVPLDRADRLSQSSDRRWLIAVRGGEATLTDEVTGVSSRLALDPGCRVEDVHTRTALLACQVQLGGYAAEDPVLVDLDSGSRTTVPRGPDWATGDEWVRLGDRWIVGLTAGTKSLYWVAIDRVTGERRVSYDTGIPDLDHEPFRVDYGTRCRGVPWRLYGGARSVVLSRPSNGANRIVRYRCGRTPALVERCAGSCGFVVQRTGLVAWIDFGARRLVARHGDRRATWPIPASQSAPYFLWVTPSRLIWVTGPLSGGPDGGAFEARLPRSFRQPAAGS
jgi:hypothetical protein